MSCRVHTDYTWVHRRTDGFFAQRNRAACEVLLWRLLLRATLSGKIEKSISPTSLAMM